MAVPVADDGVVKFKCVNGHANIVILVQERFELLSEIAVTAIVDAYFREAVASFTASMERLFEHFIRAVWIYRGVSANEASTAWKIVREQSERQLGMFLALYLAEFKNSPKLLSPKMISFRNRVVHEGIMPTEDEAIAYGQEVADVVMPLMVLLRSEPLKSAAFGLYQQIVFEREAIAEKAGSIGMVIQPIMTPFHLHSAPASVNIKERVTEYRSRGGLGKVWQIAQ